MPKLFVPVRFWAKSWWGNWMKLMIFGIRMWRFMCRCSIDWPSLLGWVFCHWEWANSCWTIEILPDPPPTLAVLFFEERSDHERLGYMTWTCWISGTSRLKITPQIGNQPEYGNPNPFSDILYESIWYYNIVESCIILIHKTGGLLSAPLKRTPQNEATWTSKWHSLRRTEFWQHQQLGVKSPYFWVQPCFTLW